MKRLLLTALAALSLAIVGVLVTPDNQMVFADAKTDVCAGLQTTGAGANCAPPPGPSVESTIRSVIDILSRIVGIVAVIMLIVGGFKYITAGGDSGNIQTAKNTIIYALVGIVIVAMAQAIIYFVLNEVTTTPEQRQQQREQNSQQ